MASDLFKEILPSILQNKTPFILTEYDEKSYPTFMVNRALSYHRDTALIANEMNQYPNLDKKLQADFLLNIVRAQKRQYSKWHKKAQSDDIDAIKEYYGYSDAKAIQALKVLDDAQLAIIKEQLYKGD